MHALHEAINAKKCQVVKIGQIDTLYLISTVLFLWVQIKRIQLQDI